MSEELNGKNTSLQVFWVHLFTIISLMKKTITLIGVKLISKSFGEFYGDDRVSVYTEFGTALLFSVGEQSKMWIR